MFSNFFNLWIRFILNTICGTYSKKKKKKNLRQRNLWQLSPPLKFQPLGTTASSITINAATDPKIGKLTCHVHCLFYEFTSWPTCVLIGSAPAREVRILDYKPSEVGVGWEWGRTSTAFAVSCNLFQESQKNFKTFLFIQTSYQPLDQIPKSYSSGSTFSGSPGSRL